MKRAIRVRRQYKSFGRGSFEWIDEPNQRILSFLRSYGDERIVVVINLSSSPQVASLDLSKHDGDIPVDLFGNSPFPTVGASRYNITLNSGNSITAYSKPRLEGGHYVYKDAKGQDTYVMAGRVREIAPRGMSTPRLNSGYSAEPTK